MELYQLEYFLETARQRNFTRAAASLHLAQAALSEQIRKLEAELGTPLFHRGRRESGLTAAGETLRGHAEGLLERAEAARRAVQDVAGLRGGRLSVGAIPSASACLLPGAIAEFRGKHPLVELALFEGTSEAVAQWVESGRVELGIVQLPTAGGRFEEHLLLTESFLALVPSAHPAARQQSISLAKLAGEPFVLYKGRAREQRTGDDPFVGGCGSGHRAAAPTRHAAGGGQLHTPAAPGGARGKTGGTSEPFGTDALPGRGGFHPERLCAMPGVWPRTVG